MGTINENGLFCDFVELKRIYDIKGTYLDYTRLLKNILKPWRENINVEPDKCAKFKNSVQIYCFVKFILKRDEGAEIYKIHLFQWSGRLFQ